ncbi:Cysteine-rich RLK 29 [Gossypium australe]|uniref:Cysteine-rich RLK 29 n=1 Tax=Gossypium australe TaxID=47621 RepID=A0A5B6W8W5_9ROSI|nr:Cysteine-rich RLK 29 [Gossypium australe]
MDSSWQFLFISFTISFLLTLAVAQEEPLDYSCMETSGNFTINSTYQTNLNRLISSFSANTANDYGFYNLSSGEGSNRVNSIALCRGDVGSGDCLGCINSATTELRSLCPDQREAIIWYDNCMFRYTNRSIFGVVDDDPLLYMWNDNNVTDVDAFNQSLSTLLDSLINSASSGTSLRKFATGSAQVTPFQTVYALVQCTPDLSQAECTSCLSAAIEFIPECCDRKQGGRVLEPSCNFRFEIERFYNLTTADTPLTLTPPPATSPPSNNTKNTTGKRSNSSRTIIIASVSAVAFAVLVVSSCIFIFLRVRKSKVKAEKGGEAAEAVDEIKNAEALQYDFSTISAATNHFSNSNKLGQGGFGAVYKVRQRGSVPMRQLYYKSNYQPDVYIYDDADPVKRAYLDWEKRYKIIGGIACGLLYLHEDSRLRIIHRDLKASNILLDAEMNPKIADFGMARLCAVDQTHGATSKIVGTYGYMAPEYAMHGQFSVKSDVFSFGVLVLEILSGQKNSSFHKGDNVDDLLSYAWRNWKDGTANELVDSTLKDS